jgi:tripartite ATP-independent transporter DctM subunit
MSPDQPNKIGFLEQATAVLLAAIALIVALEVVSRYLLNVSFAWSEEISRHLFIWASFLGAGVALKRGAHIGVDSLVTRLSESMRQRLESIVTLLVITFALLLLYYGTLTMPTMIRQESITMGFSLGWVFIAAPLGGVILAWLQARAMIRRQARGLPWVAAAAIVLILGALVGIGKLMIVPPGTLVLALVVTLIVLIAIHTPIAIAVGLASVVYLFLKRDIPLVVFPHRMVGGIDSFLLLAIPLFILAGDLMNTGGITERLVTFARALVGHIRGSLGMATVIGEYFFSGISGSSVADVSAMGSLLIPSMKRAGYRPEAAVSIIAAASAMGMLVPPCIAMVVLASLTNLSVGALFIAGFLPAACMALLLLVLIYIQARREGILRDTRQSSVELLRAFRRAILPLLMPVIILGGILGGVVTPTEAAMLGVIYALVIGMFIYREIRPRDLLPMLVNTASLTGMVMLLVGTASLLSWIFAAEGIPLLLANWMLGLSVHPAPFLLLTIFAFLVFGAVLEGLPALIILAPIFFPVAGRFGLDPLHYGIVIIGALGIGLFLPPFGVGFFIACGLGQVNVEAATRTYLPYLCMLVVGILIVAFVPWLTLVIPRLMNF